jgi:hypothetical protein
MWIMVIRCLGAYRRNLMLNNPLEQWCKQKVKEANEWWSNLRAPKGHSSSSPAPIPIRSEDPSVRVIKVQPPAEGQLSSSLLSQHEPERLYWCSFRDYMDSFVGVVICRGASPGTAANWAITSGIVESERAMIVAIPVDKEEGMLPFANRLIVEDEASEILKKLNVMEVRT